MRLLVMLGLLVLLLGITGYTLYRDSHGGDETPDHVYEVPMQTVSEEAWSRTSNQWTALLATIRLDLDDIQRLRYYLSALRDRVYLLG